jgi:hypothetical protein
MTLRALTAAEVHDRYLGPAIADPIAHVLIDRVATAPDLHVLDLDHAARSEVVDTLTRELMPLVDR